MVAKGKTHKSAGRKHHRTRARITKVRSTKPHSQRKAPKAEHEFVPASPQNQPAPGQNGFQHAPEEETAELLPKPAVEETVAHVERERSSYDGDTAIKLYLREIGQVKLLTPQEEIDLAARIKKGNFLLWR